MFLYKGFEDLEDFCSFIYLQDIDSFNLLPCLNPTPAIHSTGVFEPVHPAFQLSLICSLEMNGSELSIGAARWHHF